MQCWDTEESSAALEFGDRWIDEKRSAILLVPSVVAREEWNAIVNPLHPQSHKLVAADPMPVAWDERLFGGSR
ncbi:MAG: hypothetical protein V7642_5965 [Burkholderiales bacterium]|jgi:RES domain-containing protein